MEENAQFQKQLKSRKRQKRYRERKRHERKFLDSFKRFKSISILSLRLDAVGPLDTVRKISRIKAAVISMSLHLGWL